MNILKWFSENVLFVEDRREAINRFMVDDKMTPQESFYHYTKRVESRVFWATFIGTVVVCSLICALVWFLNK